MSFLNLTRSVLTKFEKPHSNLLHAIFLLFLSLRSGTQVSKLLKTILNSNEIASESCSVTASDLLQDISSRQVSWGWEWFIFCMSFICHCSFCSHCSLRAFFSFGTTFILYLYCCQPEVHEVPLKRDTQLCSFSINSSLCEFILYRVQRLYDFLRVSELSFSWLAHSAVLQKPVNLQSGLDLSWKNRAICLCHIRKWLACLHPVQLVYEPSFVIFVMYFCFHFWCLMNVANTIPFFSCFLHLSCAVILKTADAEALQNRGLLELIEVTILQFRESALFFGPKG